MKITLFAVAATALLIASCGQAPQPNTTESTKVCPSARAQAHLSNAEFDAMVAGGCEARCLMGSRKRLRRLHRSLDNEQLQRLSDMGCRSTSLMRNRLKSG